ncbi:MAG: pilus assembly protein PilW [Rhodocyclaceae bacterium]|nr:pilus assembly protein PilW [Rhodocyclaceae bacterium]
MVETRQISKIAGEYGFSLIELMVAMTIGSILATALVIVFANVMQTNREQFKAAQQIENGRYAIDLMTNDIRLAGYYGEFGTLPSISSFASLPDPCDVTSAALPEGPITEEANSRLGFHVQGYAASDLATRPTVPANCSALLDTNTLRPGSDIVVIRRLDTKPLLDPPNTSASVTATASDIYAQTTSKTMDIQYGVASAIDGTKNAKGASTGTLTRKDFNQALAGTPGTRPTTAAYIRKVHVHVYFVASCRDGNGANGKCLGTDDGIPTLKRLELVSESGTRKMKIVPLVEGMEFLKVRYGLDKTSHIPGQTVDGSVDDSLVPASSVTLADWQNVVMLELRVLARNTEATTGYADGKTYDLGVANYTPSGSDAKYKRHAFTSQVYIVNIGGRRES